MIVRYESWGAWVKLESMPALVALDRDGTRALGLDGGGAWEGRARPSAPIEVHLAVTSRCGAGCKGCYLDARPDGVEPPRASLEGALDAMRDAGVFTVAFGGGEPTTRDDLAELAIAARARGITPVLTTSGLGLTDARLERLRAFAQVNVSYDGAGETYASVRGFDGAAAAERAIERLAAAGVHVGVNVVLTRASFPRIHETLERARIARRARGAAPSLQAGGARRVARLPRAAPHARRRPAPCRTRCDRSRAPSATTASFTSAIDCALVPFLSADEAIARDPGRLARLGVFGCEAAGALAAVTVDGRVAPCSFAQATALPAVDLAGGHAGDPELTRWRDWSAAPPEPCASCPIRAVCKGGCKVVASFLERAHGPDPECPRVIDHRRACAP